MNSNFRPLIGTRCHLKRRISSFKFSTAMKILEFPPLMFSGTNGSINLITTHSENSNLVKLKASFKYLELRVCLGKAEIKLF